MRSQYISSDANGIQSMPRSRSQARTAANGAGQLRTFSYAAMVIHWCGSGLMPAMVPDRTAGSAGPSARPRAQPREYGGQLPEAGRRFGVRRPWLDAADQHVFRHGGLRDIAVLAVRAAMGVEQR